MADVFIHDPTRPIYGEWVFGYWCSGATIDTAFQATMQRVVYAPPPPPPDPTLILHPVDLMLVRAGGASVILTAGDTGINDYTVADTGSPDGALRLLFDPALLVDGSGYRLSFDIEAVNAPTGQLIINWCDSPPFVWDASMTNPVVVDFSDPPLGYNFVRCFLEVRLPDFEAGDFRIRNVTAVEL